ncbi:MAG: hypothetical protein ACRCU6_10360 [Fusobacteriaceae bacterium]
MVITEYSIRSQLKENQDKKYYLVEGDILTPSARQILMDRGIEIIKNSENSISKKNEIPMKDVMKEIEIIEKLPKFKGLLGEYYLEKGEKLTHLRDNILVPKNHKRIFLRGRIDNLLGEWNLVHRKLSLLKNTKLNSDLDSVYSMIKKVMLAEIKDELLENVEVLGYSLSKLKEVSHNPKKNFGIDHLFDINSSYDETVLELNRIRTIVRMCELHAADAFSDSWGEKENKLMEAFNRLSSAIYVIMIKGKSGVYGIR